MDANEHEQEAVVVFYDGENTYSIGAFVPVQTIDTVSDDTDFIYKCARTSPYPASACVRMFVAGG